MDALDYQDELNNNGCSDLTSDAFDINWIELVVFTKMKRLMALQSLLIIRCGGRNKLINLDAQSTIRFNVSVLLCITPSLSFFIHNKYHEFINFNRDQSINN
jgi:hypothetical protein